MTMNKLTKKHVKKSISDATRQKIREARARQIMKPMSEETKRKIGKANKGKTNPRKGTKGLHKHSQETKNKLSDLCLSGKIGFQKGNNINLGRKLSQEHKDKIIAWNKKYWSDQNHRDNSSKIMMGRKNALGHKQTKETIAKRMNTMKPIFESEQYKGKLREKRLHQVFPQKDSKPEIMMQTFLDLNNIKYQKHKPILGQPDIFIKPNICLFVDGCYFHGCQECHPNLHKKHAQIEKQMLRDTKITHDLMEQGYVVLRIWEHRIDPTVDSEGILRLIQSQALRSTSMNITSTNNKQWRCSYG